MCIVLICIKNKVISQTVFVVYPIWSSEALSRWGSFERRDISWSPVEDQIPTPSDLVDFSYSELKLPDCLYATSSVGKSEWALVYKIVDSYCRPNLSSLFLIYNEINKKRCLISLIKLSINCLLIKLLIT